MGAYHLVTGSAGSGLTTPDAPPFAPPFECPFVAGSPSPETDSDSSPSLSPLTLLTPAAFSPSPSLSSSPNASSVSRPSGMTNSPRVTCFGGTRPVSISGGSIFQIVLKSMAGSEVKNGCRLIASIPSPLPPSRSVGSRTFVCNTQTSTTESLGRDRAKGKAHEELLHEIFRVGREFGREVVLELDNLLEDEVLCSSLERRPPGKYLIQDAAEAPIVGSGKFRDEVSIGREGTEKKGGKRAYDLEDSLPSERISGDTYSGVPTKERVRVLAGAGKTLDSAPGNLKRQGQGRYRLHLSSLQEASRFQSRSP